MSAADALDAPGLLVVRNEFAVVGVALSGEPGRRRLRIEDLRTQASVELDALELECLAWCRHRDLEPLLDPSLTRWPGEQLASRRNGNGS